MGKKRRGRRRGRKAGETGAALPVEAAAPRTEPAGGTARPALSGRHSRRLRRAILIAAALIVAGGAGALWLYGPGRRTRVPRDGALNVLLITLDATRPDRLGCYGYAKGKTPAIDNLARRGVRFENAYASVPLTLPSHCSIMTGLTPPGHGVHNNGRELGPEPETLAQILKRAGLRTAAVVASFAVDSRFGLDRGFDSYDDSFQPWLPFKPLNSERKAEEVAAAFGRWLDGNAGSQFFAWVHFFDPHLPYRPPSPYREEFATDPYDGEVAYMDFQVGQVVNKLAEKRLLGRTLIVLAGDHGEAFGEKVETGHGVFLYDETLRVPLIFFAENSLPQGRVVRSRVRLIDILPSILDLLGQPTPTRIQGVSLVPFIEGRTRRDLDVYLETFFPRESFGWSELVGLVRGDWKFIRAPRPELYDLAKDPGESRNLVSTAARRAADLNARLETLIREGTVLSAKEGTPAVEVQDRLISLGYSSLAGGKEGAVPPDPKDELEALRQAQQAEAFEYQERYAEAAAVWEPWIESRPAAPAVYIHLALCQARRQKFDDAVRTLRTGLARFPGSEPLLARLGHTYLVTGRLGEALATMGEVLGLNPRNVDALTVSAGVLDTMGRRDEARAHYERAIGIEPESKYLRMSYAASLMSSGLIDRALVVYEGLVKDYPNDQVVCQVLGVAYGVSGDYARSVECLKQAVYLKPTPTAYYNLATAYRKLGNIGEAVRYLRLYLDDPKGEPEAAIQAARSELKRLEASLSK
jgi:arylsulfatase A-like enzyme/Flp pilus assembly protein TadD